jgi:hypothetical protein
MQTNSKNTLQKLSLKYIRYSSKHPVGTRVYCPFAYKSGVVYMYYVTHCDQKCGRKEIFQSGFFDVNRVSQ